MAAFPRIPKERFGVVPAVVSFPVAQQCSPRRVRNEAITTFGVIGQIRAGKGIAQLVQAFAEEPTLGELTVAGDFASTQAATEFEFLRLWPGFVRGFLPEGRLHAIASDQDYLLALYDTWDHRMECGTLFLAASVGRPVVVFARGSAGRVVQQTGCGLAIYGGWPAAIDTLRSLPARESPEYQVLLSGVHRFRARYGADEAIPELLRHLFEE